MRRRTVLRSAGSIAGVAALSGCLSVFGTGSNPDVALDESDRQFESSDVAYPAWGERVPDVTLAAPLDSREVSVRSVSKPALLTFFYSHCQTVCPVLISTFRNIQTHAANNGYASEVTFLPVTFDPARDTVDRLQTYADEMNADADADNWHFLRPESRKRAKAVVEDRFGVVFQRTEPEDIDTYMFTHSALTLLVNGDGYVERAYRSKSPDEETIIADLKQVRTS
jgi:protein SCO1/2